MNPQTTDRDIQLIAEALGESRLGDDTELAAALLALRTESTATMPAPSPEIRAHFTSNVVSLASRRARKAAMVAGAVIVIMGLGVGSAAAISPEFRQATNEAVESIVEKITGKSAEAPGQNKTTDDNNGVGNDETDPGVTNSGNNNPDKNNGKRPLDNPSVDRPTPTPNPNAPEGGKPDTSTPDTSKPDTSKPDTVKPDSEKPVTDKPGAPPAPETPNAPNNEGSTSGDAPSTKGSSSNGGAAVDPGGPSTGKPDKPGKPGSSSDR